MAERGGEDTRGKGRAGVARVGDDDEREEVDTKAGSSYMERGVRWCQTRPSPWPQRRYHIGRGERSSGACECDGRDSSGLGCGGTCVTSEEVKTEGRGDMVRRAKRGSDFRSAKLTVHMRRRNIDPCNSPGPIRVSHPF